MKRSDRRRRRLLAAGAVLAIIVVSVGAFLWIQESARQRNLVEARKDGLAHHHQGEYAQALPRLSYVVTRDPADVEVLLAFADARSRIPLENDRHLGESIALYLAALHHEPQHMEALAGLLGLYERTGRRLEWVETAERILALSPDHIDALRLMALGHAVVSNFEEAMSRMARLIDLEPDVLQWRIFYLQILRDADTPTREMLAVCDQWIEESRETLAEQDGRFHMLRASVLSSVGERDEARAVARIAASPDKGAAAPEVLQQLLALLDALQLRAEAAVLIERTKARFPSEHWPHEAAVRRHWQHSRPDEGLAAIDAVRQSHGALSTPLMRWKALLLVQKDELDRARNVLATLEHLTHSEPESNRDAHRAWIEAVRARIEFDAPASQPRQWRDALETYRRSIALEPNDALLHYLIGEAYLRVGEDELALASLERAVRADPSWVAAQILYAESLLRLGRAETAAHVAAGLVRRIEQPTMGLYLLFARAWMASGLSAGDLGIAATGSVGQDGALDPARFLEVLRQHASASGDSAESAEIVRLLVEKLLHDGSERRAAEVIEDVLAREDADPAMLIGIARASAGANLGFEQQLIDRAVAEIGMTLEIAEIQARIFHQAGRTDEGRRLLEEVLRDRRRDLSERGFAQRVLASYLVWIDAPDAPDALAAVLEDAQGSPDDIAFVLAQPVTWQHAELAQRGVELLAQSLGESSIRVSLAQATYILHFEREHPAEMARALVIVNELLHRTPESLGALTLMSSLHMASNPPDVDAAIRQLQRAVRAHPRRADLYPQLIALLQRQGDFDAARRYLSQFSELSSRHERLRRAELRLLESQGDFQSIIARLGRQLANTTSEEDRAILLAALHRAGRADEAEKIAGALLEQAKPRPESLGAVAQFYADTGRVEKALELLRDHEALTPFESALLLAHLNHYIGSTEDAERSLLRAAQLAPDDPRAWDALADHYLRLGDHREARTAARAGLAAAPDRRSLQTKLVLASLNLGGQAREEAVALLDTLGRDDRALAATLTLYSRIASRENGAPAARDLEDAARLVRDHSGFLPAWRLAIAAHVQAGALERAADLAERAAHRFPNQSEPAELATRILIDLRRTQSALNMAEMWRSRSLNRTLDPDVTIAALLVDLGRTTAAVAQLEPHEERIISQRGDRPEHLHTLLRALIHAGAIDRAIAIVEPLHRTGDAAWAPLMPALAHGAASDNVSRLLLALEPMFAPEGRGRLALAQEWVRLGAVSEATEHFERAEQHALEAARIDESLSPHARLLRGLISDFRSDLGAAEEHYRHVLEIDPHNAMALNNLAHVLLRRGGAPEEAVELSRRALDLLPAHPDILDTHAQALLKAGRPEQAEPLAARALEQRPNDAAALLTLAGILLAQDRAVEAHETFQRASTAMSSSSGVSAHVRSKHSEVERAILAATLDSPTDS